MNKKEFSSKKLLVVFILFGTVLGSFASTIYAGPGDFPETQAGTCSYRYAHVGQAPRGDYTGQCQNGKAHGMGTIAYDSGAHYEGSFQQGLIYGQGTFVDANGNRYEGAYLNGRKHGQGTFVWAGGIRYDGEFQNGKRHGQGAYVWPDGNRYDGEFQNGKRHGQGTQVYPDGTRYEGEWQQGKPNGLGTKYQPNGTRQEGYFQNNELLNGTVYFYDGKTCEVGNGQVASGVCWTGKKHLPRKESQPVPQDRVASTTPSYADSSTASSSSRTAMQQERQARDQQMLREMEAAQRQLKQSVDAKEVTLGGSWFERFGCLPVPSDSNRIEYCWDFGEQLGDIAFEPLSDGEYESLKALMNLARHRPFFRGAYNIAYNLPVRHYYSHPWGNYIRLKWDTGPERKQQLAQLTGVDLFRILEKYQRPNEFFPNLVATFRSRRAPGDPFLPLLLLQDCQGKIVLWKQNNLAQDDLSLLEGVDACLDRTKAKHNGVTDNYQAPFRSDQQAAVRALTAEAKWIQQIQLEKQEWLERQGRANAPRKAYSPPPRPTPPSSPAPGCRGGQAC